jgi:oleate hydratase
MGQYCEIADHVVFTVEYSVRSAMTAVYAQLGVRKKVPGVRRTDRNPFV